MNPVRISVLILFAVFFVSSARAQEGSSPAPAQPFRLGSTLEFKSESSLNLYYKETVESVALVNGQLEIVKRSASYPVYVPAVACWPNNCDLRSQRVWKEVYGVKDGKLILLETIEGKIVPAQAERVEWPK